MTRRLYEESAYLTEWKTNIISTLERGDSCYVVLEESAFYPEGGGQPCDGGTIDGIAVLDVIREEDEILHRLERLPEVSAVACRIDWNRRFDHMQHHSGQHLLSAVCLKLHQAKTLSFHLGTDYATIDVEIPELTPEQLDHLEKEVNRQIYLNRGIVSYVVSGEEASCLPLVKPPKVTENIRIVEITDVEYNACGGTHVSSTGEIGMIKLLKAEKYKGGTRIYFKCGTRALAEFHECQRILGVLAARFQTGKDQILDRVEKWEQEHKQLQAELAALREKNDRYVADELLRKREGSLIESVFQEKSLKELQSLAGMLTEQCGYPVLLATAAENKVVLAHNGSLDLSCGAFFKEHLGAYNGKGGGSPKLAQAGFNSWKDADAFYEFAKRSLEP